METFGTNGDDVSVYIRLMTSALRHVDMKKITPLNPGETEAGQCASF